MAIIEIENMEFYSYHGCFKEEQVVGNHFQVNILVEANTEAAQQTDNLNDTINYQVIYNLVAAEMQQKSKLLEHVAQRIIGAISRNFPQVIRVRVKVSKINPPMGGKIDRVSVTLEQCY